MDLPKKYVSRDSEAKWRQAWKDAGIYAWDPTRGREETFVVDTPPPTVSGSLHVGHLFSYSHQDFIVRYQRMRGKNIFFPIGWDDNGLPTERRVQNLFNVRCDPHLHYDPQLKPQRGGKGDPTPISRTNFIELCRLVTREDEEAFRNLWSHLGLSYDWSEEYATIDRHCRIISQRSFLKLLEQGEIYQDDRPVFWDVDFRTAIAQAELADREIAGAYNYLRFEIEGTGEHAVIATTRPELLGACVAVLAHPEDERYRKWIGKRAVTPLYRAPVPIVADESADPEKGTGILMVCTFGDQMDVEWWRAYGLPLRQIIGRDGRILPVNYGQPGWDTLDPDTANRVHAELAGLRVRQAQKRIMEIAAETDGVVDRPRTGITHAVRFFEKGDLPLELIPARQWFAKILDKKEELVAQGRKIKWHPPHMGIRYEHWVEGLNQDWCLSRQRYFGVPIPVWYRLDSNGEPVYSEVLTPSMDQLPCDPLDQVPQGYVEEQRDRPDGFTGDPDVLDTWATSSLTPQIATQWELNPDRHGRLFPMDIRPQSHEIIRTWAFYTILKAYTHEREIPWRHVVISGWILDPDRKKMSKSHGNVVTPEPLLNEFGSDSVRYWAARARLGVDTAYDEQVFRIGTRLVTKLFNAGKFSIMQFSGLDPAILTPEAITVETDRLVVDQLRPVMARATEALEAFDYAQALAVTEEYFWRVFCDNYLELAKARTYEEGETPGRVSAAATLRLVHRVLLRLFAPFLPYVTEEIWHWVYSADTGMQDSIHQSPWPLPAEVDGVARPRDPEVFEHVLAVAEAVRRAKSEAKVSMRNPVRRARVGASAAILEGLRGPLEDVCRMLHIENLDLHEKETGDQPVTVETELGEA